MDWRELAAIFPDLATDRVARWVGKLRVHAPFPLPTQRRWSLLSSRLPRALDEHPEWFERLRTAAGQARDHGGCLVAVEGTAPCRFVLHAARRFALPALFVRFATQQPLAASAKGELGGDPVELWVQAPAPVELDRKSTDEPPRAVENDSSTAGTTSAVEAVEAAEAAEAGSIAAPPVTAEPLTMATARDAAPLRDRLLWLLGQELRVLAVRRGGSVERLIAAQQRESPGWQPLRLDIPVATALHRPLAAPVTTKRAATKASPAPLSLHSPLEERSVTAQIGAPVGAQVGAPVAGQIEPPLVPLGVPLGVPPGVPPGVSPGVPLGVPPGVSSVVSPITAPVVVPVSGPVVGSVVGTDGFMDGGTDGGEQLPWPALWHATRRHEGPWEGQTESEFLDELLFERPERDRSALATLRRIIGERRLRASSWALRGSVPSVCFSAVPLHQRPAMRTFRAHRGRWDAEPFGIAIRAELLAQLGARPVIYGDDAVWESLSESDRPWFQRQSTRGGKSAIDWTGEQEWRLLGDLPLAELPRDSVRVFVPDMATAACVAGESPWPVLALDTLVRTEGR